MINQYPDKDSSGGTYSHSVTEEKKKNDLNFKKIVDHVLEKHIDKLQCENQNLLNALKNLHSELDELELKESGSSKKLISQLFQSFKNV